MSFGELPLDIKSSASWLMVVFSLAPWLITTELFPELSDSGCMTTELRKRLVMLYSGVSVSLKGSPVNRRSLFSTFTARLFTDL